MKCAICDNEIQSKENEVRIKNGVICEECAAKVFGLEKYKPSIIYSNMLSAFTAEDAKKRIKSIEDVKNGTSEVLNDIYKTTKENKEERARRDEISIPINDLYEYDVVTVSDNSGSTNVTEMKRVLREHAEKRWRLVNTFTNELGVNSSSFHGYGTNSTVDEVVMIFERRLETAKNE